MKSDKIKNWPVKERPRERLIAEGAERLTDAELLAIILRLACNLRNLTSPFNLRWNPGPIPLSPLMIRLGRPYSKLLWRFNEGTHSLKKEK